MSLEDMTLEELLEMLKSGRVFNINSYYMRMYIRYLEELKETRKALELACDSLLEGYGNECGLFKGKICYECAKEDCKVGCLCEHLTPSYFLQKVREEKNE